MDRPHMRISATVLGAPDPRSLAEFYERLLGWTRVADEPEAGVAWARETGASLAEHQPQEHVRVMFDPVGHPFCLFPGSV